MTSMTSPRKSASPRPAAIRRMLSGRIIGWLRANLFASISSSVMSLLLIAGLARCWISLVQWGYRERDLDCLWRSDRPVPGDPRHRRLWP